MSDYEKYQLEWMISNGYSLRGLMEELAKLQCDDPEDHEQTSTPVSELFAQWESDVGFGSEIWACEEEWAECEGIEKFQP